MRTIVAGYHNMGCEGLEALIRNGYDVVAVFTYVDAADEVIWFGSVAEAAARHNIPVYTPDNINHPLWLEKIRELKPDVLFSFYYQIYSPLIIILSENFDSDIPVLIWMLLNTMVVL